MATFVFALIVAVVLTVLVWAIATGKLFGKSAEVGRDRVGPPMEGPTLRYHVPPGQDAAVVVAALINNGYDAAPRTVEGEQVVVVPVPNGLDAERERVREVIQQAHASTLVEGVPVDRDVLFDDESPPRR